VSSPGAVTLEDGHWRVVVLPHFGGCLQKCAFDGETILQPAAPLAGLERVPASYCYFPMIPFVNRVENARFECGGRVVQLVPNEPGAPHALHGHGWQLPWQVTRATSSSCALSYVREATIDWPWQYEGTQSFAVADDRLRIALSIRNLGDTAMPCGLGFHPFLPDTGGSRLTFDAEAVWNGPVSRFPRKAVRVPPHLSFAGGAMLSERKGLDHCFEGWRERRALVSCESSSRTIVIDGCEGTRFVVVYVPGKHYFCVEPVTHAAGALNLPDVAGAGVWFLEPGESRQIAMTVSVLRAEGANARKRGRRGAA
jgi:aldose 1-epimerase